MKTIDGKCHMQVKDLIEMLEFYPKDSVVYGTFFDDRKKYFERGIYKTAETADPEKVYLYLL